jgi:polar amino acid transport system substrate-binding protein
VPEASPLRSVEDVDREGVRVASAARAAYTLYLQRTLKQARVIEVDGQQGTADAFAKGTFDALAGLKPRILEDVGKIPGTRVIPGRFTAVQQSMAVPKPHAAAAAYLVAFVDEIKKSGLLQRLIDTHHASGLTVAR